MLSRVKLLSLPKAIQWKFSHVSKYYSRRGYRANFSNYVYLKLAYRIVCKVKTIVPLQNNVNVGKPLSIDQRKQVKVLSWLGDIVPVFIRIIVITTIVLGLLTFYWVNRCLSTNTHPTIYLQGIEFLGPTFIKFGQWISIRRDMFPEELCSTLSSLQHNTTAHSWEYTKNVLETTYGSIWHQLFVEINPVPVGSGCCAQVYQGRVNVNYLSPDIRPRSNIIERRSKGIPVAIKVLHPKIRERLKLDLTVLKFLSICVTGLMPNSRWLSITDCIHEFSEIMEKQVDLRLEAENLKTFSRNFASIPEVGFPQPFCNISSDEILVETFHEGRYINDYLSVNDESLRHILAKIGVYTVFKMIFEDNLVHCDLHPGNILVQEHSPLNPLRDPHIVILDCGLVTELNDKCLDNLRDVFRFVIVGDVHDHLLFPIEKYVRPVINVMSFEKKGKKIADSMMEHSVSDCPNPEGFREAIDGIVKRYWNHGIRLNEIDVSQVISELFSAMVRYRVKNDGSFSSVILSIAVIESLGRSLDPNINLIYEAMPFLINNGF